MANATDLPGEIVAPPIPRALVSANPLEWLRVFGPGAVIASLTIGTGELIFSARGGLLFGYGILFPMLLICVLKWTLAYSAARHMVISGVHPFERWMDLPFGPRGWLTVLFFILAVMFIPVWASFHASVLGDLMAYLTDTKRYLGGATIHLWGTGLLLSVFALCMVGGYSALEKIQIAIVAGMLGAVIITLFIFGPNWLELLSGFFIPRRLEYPDWLATDPQPLAQTIASSPVWVEVSLYTGVIGGASYDYLAYASYLRDKQWGNAAPAQMFGEVGSDELAPRASMRPAVDGQALRQWIRAPLIDCTLSFLVVLVFSAVFVASGKLVLAPLHQIPGDGAFLEHQATFVTSIHPWLLPLYVVGAFLTMFGTLYGTLEIAPTILREMTLALARHKYTSDNVRRIRLVAIGWCTIVALAVLAVNFVYQLQVGQDKPAGLTGILKPVNLFTGVFGCGLICLSNPWIDRRLASEHRMPLALAALNLVGGIAFIVVAVRGYWDYGRSTWNENGQWWAMGVLVGMLAFGVLTAWLMNVLRRRD
jgi:hypothetical protein